MDIVTLIKYRHSKKYLDNNDDKDILPNSNWNYTKDLILIKNIKNMVNITDISTHLQISVKCIQKRIIQLIEMIGMQTNTDYTNKLLKLENNNIELTEKHLQLAGNNGGYNLEQLKLLGISWPPRKGWKQHIIGEYFEKQIIDKFINFNKDSSVSITQYFTKIEKQDNIEFKPHYYVYTDGACKYNGSKDAVAGYGIYFGDNDSRNISQALQGYQTNNTAELIALIKVYDIIINDLEKGKKIGIVSDSKYAIGCCLEYGDKCAKSNWGINKKNPIRPLETKI